MKKNLFYAMLFLMVIFASCKKDNNNENESQGTLQFGLSVPQQLSEQKSVSPGEVPSSIVISISDSKGKVAVESKKIVLFNMNGSYISESLSLVIGNYSITKFLVLNNFDSVIYATPLKGSKLAYLITTPLPIAFKISRNSVTKVVPEVLSAKSFKPEDFGYSSFSFDVVKTFDFLATVMVYNLSVKNWELTTANMIIRTADNTIAYSGTLEAITNQITLRDNSMSYIINVNKVGYHTYTATFTADELKLYFRSEDKGPLIIRLGEDNSDKIPRNGLVAYYTFSGGDAKDLSGNGNNGIINGAISSNDRFLNPHESFQFNSENDYIIVKNPGFLDNNKGTFLAWVKFDNLDHIQYVASVGDTNSIESYISFIRLDQETHTLGLYQREVNAANWINGTTIISPNTYYHVVMMSDGLSWTIYINGQKETLIIKKGNNTGKWINGLTGIDNFVIGSSIIKKPYTVPYLKGNIDEVLLYNRPLTESEIKFIYNLKK